MNARHHFQVVVKISLASVLSLFLLEALCLAYIWIDTGHLFYAIPREDATDPPFQRQEKHKNHIHPYLGYGRGPGSSVGEVVLQNGRIRWMTDTSSGLPDWVKLKANNQGFFSEKDYPYFPQGKNHFIVGVFGGSVAQWLCVQQGDYLGDRVRDTLGRSNKEVVILNFANGGYKQPQQLLALSYFFSAGQKLDLIVNIDGFNEVVLPAENARLNVDHTLPRSYPSIVSIPMSISDEATFTWLLRIRDLTDDVRHWKRLSDQRISAVLHIVGKARLANRRATLQMLRSQAPLSSKRSFRKMFIAPEANHKEFEDKLIQLWLESSIAMHDLADRRGVRYLHVLQPNQYYGSKKLTDMERRIAFRPDSGYAQLVRRYYPHLVERAGELSERGVDFLDATEVFDGVSGRIYSDTCCHYNDEGNKRLIDAIISQLATHEF